MSYVTEAQAREKWCPHARGIGWEIFRDGEKPATMNRMIDGGAHAGCLCIGSACMSWRFVDAEPPEKAKEACIQWPTEERLAVLNDGEPERPADLPNGYEWVPLTGYTGNDDDPDVDGAFWQESETSRAARVAELYANRRGYCGLAGAPE